MQSEIKFLLDLVLNHKLPPTAKKACLERIGEVEQYLVTAIRPQPVMAQGPTQKSAAQLRFEMEQAVGAPIQVNVDDAETIVAPVVAPVKRIVGGEIHTGNGTRGPRKF